MNAEMSKDPESKLGNFKHHYRSIVTYIISFINYIFIKLYIIYIIGYRISDQVEFCSSDQPSSCKISQNAVNSSSNRLIFEVDLKKRYFSKDKDVRIDAERIPVKLQREDCLCGWRLCNQGLTRSGNIYIILVSIPLLLMFVVT